MWRCERCGQESENKIQDHFCNDILDPIDEYIEAQPENIRPILVKVRQTIRAAAPNAIEKISWRMPTFWQKENLIHFGAFKRHMGIYPGDLSLMPFEARLEGYHRTKGAIQFPYDNPIDYNLIADITRWRVSCIDGENKSNTNKEPSETKGKLYEYDTVIQAADKGGAYVVFPYDIRAEFGKGRVKVHATFNGEPYDGSVVNMGVKYPDGSVCYIIGIRKDIRAKIGKKPGDSIHITIRERT